MKIFVTILYKKEEFGEALDELTVHREWYEGEEGFTVARVIESQPKDNPPMWIQAKADVLITLREI